MEVGRGGRQRGAELGHPAVVVQVHRDDLGGQHRRQVHGLAGRHPAPVPGDQVVPRRGGPARRRRPAGSCGTRSSAASRPAAAMGPACRWPVEPEVDLAGAHRIFIVAIRTRGGGHRPLARAPPPSSGNARTGPPGAPSGTLASWRSPGRGPRPRSHAIRSRSAARASAVLMCTVSLASCARSSRSDQNVWDIAPEASSRTVRSRLRDGRAERPPRPQEVLGVAGLRRADRDPPLAEPAAEVVPQVDGGVVRWAGTGRRWR